MILVLRGFGIPNLTVSISIFNAKNNSSSIWFNLLQRFSSKYCNIFKPTTQPIIMTHCTYDDRQSENMMVPFIPKDCFDRRAGTIIISVNIEMYLINMILFINHIIAKVHI